MCHTIKSRGIDSEVKLKTTVSCVCAVQALKHETLFLSLPSFHHHEIISSSRDVRRALTCYCKTMNNGKRAFHAIKILKRLRNISVRMCVLHRTHILHSVI